MKLLTEIKQVFADVWAAFLYVLRGKPDDPKEYADDPPTFWHKPTPVANVDKKNKPVEVVFQDERWTVQEISQMTDEYFKRHVRWKVPCNTRTEFIQYLKGKEIISKKSNAKEIQF